MGGAQEHHCAGHGGLEGEGGGHSDKESGTVWLLLGFQHHRSVCGGEV